MVRNNTDLIEAITKDFGGVLGSKPVAQCMDFIHERLLEFGVSEDDAFEINRQIMEARPHTPYQLSTFEFFLTTTCNLACPYCFIHHKRPRSMTPEVVDGAVAFVKERRSLSRPTRVVFMGGEPLLEFPIVKRVVEELGDLRSNSGKSISFDITSNGTLVTEEMMKFFSVNNVKLLLSVDGGRKTHNRQRVNKDNSGTFDAIVDRIPMIRRYQPYLGSKMTPTPETVHRLSEDVQTLVELGFRRLLIGPATGVEWPLEKLDTLREQVAAVVSWRQGRAENGLRLSFDEIDLDTKNLGVKDDSNCWGCRAGRTGIAFDVDGSLSPCSKVIGVSKKAGDVLNLGSVHEAEMNEDTRYLLSGVVPATRQECRKCELKHMCHGGCPANNIDATGSPFKPARSVCATIKAVVSGCKQALEDPSNCSPRL